MTASTDMISIAPLTALLAAETIAVLSLTLLVLGLRSRRSKRRERIQADHLVERLNRTERAPMADLEAEQVECGGLIPKDTLQYTADAVRQREKALFRHVLQAFLNRDVMQLREVETHVRALVEPYRQLLPELARHSAETDATTPPARIACLEQQLQTVCAENEQLRQRLEETLQELDYLSREYARMFGTDHEAEASPPRGRFGRGAGDGTPASAERPGT